MDSLLTFLIGIANPQTVLQFNPSYTGGAQIALYAGLLVGALSWGLSADIIGRKWAFNLSLLVASIFTIIAGASPNYPAFATFVALAASGAGGNLVLDTTVFLEFLPSKYQFMIIIMALWWGVGQTIAALFAWAFMSESLQCGQVKGGEMPLLIHITISELQLRHRRRLYTVQQYGMALPLLHIRCIRSRS